MKKNIKGFTIIEGLIAVALIGLIGVIIWFAFSKPKTNSDNQPQTSVSGGSQASTADLTPEEVVSKVKSTYAGKYTLLNLDENNQPKTGQMSIRSTKRAPVYKVSGYKFYTDYDEGSSLELMAGPVNWLNDELPRQVDTVIRIEIIKIYEDFGLVKSGDYGTTSEGSGRIVYTGQNIICVTESPQSPTSSTSASCGQLDAYNDVAEKIKPMADVIPYLDEATVLTNLKTKDSSVSGYQTAELGMGSIKSGGGSAALLYKKNTGPWVYFQNTQNILSCSAFNTTDLKNAYKGTSCHNTSTNSLSTVQ